MRDFSDLLPETKALAPLKVAGEPPVDLNGQDHAKPMVALGAPYGDYGVSKDRRAISYDFVISAKQKYLLRKRHPFVAAVHNAIIRQACKVEIEVCPIDDKKGFNAETKSRMETFVQTGFGEEGEKGMRGRLIDTKKWNGDAWAEIIFDAKTKEPARIKYLFAETMRVMPNVFGDIESYPQVVDGVLNYNFSPQNILHLKENHDEYSFFAYSGIDSLYFALTLDILGDEYNQKFLENNASPSGALVFDNDIDQKELNNLRWETIIQLRQNPNKPIFLNRVKQWIPMGLVSKDMDWQELHRAVKEKCMMVYGVLPMQVSVVETGKLANPEQQLEIGEEYIWQELQNLQMLYNSKFTPFFDGSDNLMFRFRELDPKLDAMQKKATILQTKADAISKLSATGAFEEDELREIIDLGPRPIAPAVPAPGQPVLPPASAPAPAQGPAPQPSTAPPTPTGAKAKSIEIKPFGGYTDFADCVSQNGDKEDPNAYCASVMQATEAADSETKMLDRHKALQAKNRMKLTAAFKTLTGKFNRQAIKLAKSNYSPPQKLKSITDFNVGMQGLALALAEKLAESMMRGATDSYIESRAALGITATLTQVDERAIMELLKAGGSMDAVKAFPKEQVAGFKDVIDNAFKDGLDTRAMVKEMQSYADTQDWKLERIARTETNRFANQGRVAGYKDLEERRGETYEYEWVGPLDDRTSEQCADIMAANPYSLEALMQASDDGEPHPNCRHNIVRVVK